MSQIREKGCPGDSPPVHQRQMSDSSGLRERVPGDRLVIYFHLQTKVEDESMKETGSETAHPPLPLDFARVTFRVILFSPEH